MEIENFALIKELIEKIETLDKFRENLSLPDARFLIVGDSTIKADKKNGIAIEDWLREPLQKAIDQSIDAIKERLKKL